jgi:hypothetical protein
MKRNFYRFAVIAILIVFGGGSVVSAETRHSRLVLLTEPEPTVSFSMRVVIQVRFLDPDAQPIPDAFISFAPQSDTADTELRNLNALTNSDGVAETYIEAGVQEIDFDVLIIARDDDVPPLTVHVRVVPEDGLLKVKWPSNKFRSIQDAINALADGGTLKIAKGVYEIDPIFIRGKTVHIKGSGSSCKMRNSKKGKGSLGTVLMAPVKDRVANPDEVVASLHFIDAGGSVKNLNLVGGDAGIAGRETDLGSSKPLEVNNTCITDAGRGIHWKATAQLTVTDTFLKDIKWNGISISPSKISSIEIMHSVENVFIWAPQNFCIYVENSAAGIANDYLVNCQGGGIAATNSVIWVDETIILNAKKAGIFLEASYGDLYDNIILGTDADPDTGFMGDGVVAWDGSTVYMFENNIEITDRAAVSNFGSYVALGDNHFRCQSFDMNGEKYLALDFVYNDLLDNLCGCPIANGPCSMVSSSLEPPPPVGGLE